MTTKKRFIRKESVPAASVAAKRTTQSLGPTAGFDTDGSMIEIGSTAAYTTNVSVTKGSKSSNQYPNYFYTPKENLFDSKR